MNLVRPVMPVMLLIAVCGHAHARDATSRGFDVVRYEVTLRPDPATESVSGKQTIFLKASDSTTEALSFSPNALVIEGAKLDGQPIAVTHDASDIRFELPEPLRAGQTATLKFEFKGTPARGLQKSGDILYTSYFACDWMVCLQDAPGDKADFSLDLILPKEVRSGHV